MLQERKIRVHLRATVLPPLAPPLELSPAERYINTLLAGGPMLKNNIYRQSQVDGYIWSDIIDAKDSLNLNHYSINGFEYWKLFEY